MNRILQSLVFFSFLLLVANCQPNDQFSICGNLPDSSYDGEYIYLVPMENATKDKVDSVQIKNGTFCFSGTIKTPEVFILRTKHLLRFKLQELLIVKEAGAINVKIGQNSSATGTALNDSLQLWKEQKMMSDSLLFALRKQYRALNDSLLQTRIKLKADSLNNQISNFNYNFVRNNMENAVGKMVYQLKKNSFTAEQKEKLGTIEKSNP